MNKKTLMFGLIGIFALAMATAALVPYLSNVISGNAEVESPITMSGTLNGTQEEVYGGEGFSKTIVMENNANATIDTYAQVTITGPDSWDSSLEEFDVLDLYDETHSQGPFNLLNDCQIDGTDDKILRCALGLVSVGALETWNYRIDVGLDQAIMPGTYTFEVQAMD